MSERERFERVVEFLNEIRQSEESDRDEQLENDLDGLLQDHADLVAKVDRLQRRWDAAMKVLNDSTTKMLSEALAATEGSDGDEKADSEWLDIIEGECWDLRCLDVATFGGDYEVEWIVIEHHQAAPRQRQIGRGDSPVTALQDAVARTTSAPPTTDAEGGSNE
jgi:hypothetical protein